MEPHPATLPTIDATHAQAVFRLASTLFDYGQFERALSILELAEWMSDDMQGITTLRIKVLCRLGRLEHALDLCLDETEILDDALVAEVYWVADQAGLKVIN